MGNYWTKFANIIQPSHKKFINKDKVERINEIELNRELQIEKMEDRKHVLKETLITVELLLRN